MSKAAKELLCAMMRDFCVKSYREHYDKVGWLWSTNVETSKEEAKYQEAMPVISAVVKLAILLTKEELI